MPEYLVKEFSYNNDENLTKQLSKLGEEGWILVDTLEDYDVNPEDYDEPEIPNYSVYRGVFVKFPSIISKMLPDPILNESDQQ